MPGAPLDARRRILLTEADATRRAVMKIVLAESGYAVTDCADAAQVMQRVKSVVPDVILIDAALPHEQARQCIRMLKRCYQTSAIAIVLTCPPAMDNPSVAALMRDGAALVLHRPYSRVRLLEAAALASKQTAISKADMATALGQQTPNARRVKSNNALLARPIACPFHDDRPQFDRYLLRPGAVAAHNSFLDIPEYDATLPGYDRVNYQLLSIMVCPECLFASSHPGYFLDPSEHKERHITFSPESRSAIAADAAARRQLAQARHISSNFFNEHRSPTDAALAYELAIHCSEIIYEKNKYALGGELLRRGNYHLRLAQLQEMRTPPAPDRIRKYLLAAIAPLRKAEAVLDGAVRYKAIYQLMALAIMLNEDSAASAYLNRLADQEAAALGENKAHATQYLDRARTAWENRAAHRVPEAMEAAA